MLIGFKRLKVQVFDEEGAPSGEPIVIEGKQDEGATQEATISGLSAEPTKIYGSNVAYYVSQRGTGEVKVAFTLFDVPDDAEGKMLGYTVDEALKAQFIGESTEPPYCAILLESEDAKGNTAAFGFFKGKFSAGDVALKTKEGGGYTPNSQSYTFSPVTSDWADKSKGSTMVKFLGSESERAAIEALVFHKPTGGGANVASVSKA